MKKLVVVIALVFLTAVANGHRGTIVSFPGSEEAVSPNGRFAVVNADSDAEPHHTLFLVDRSTKTKRKLLDYGRHVEVLWNPNSELVAVTDYESSNVARCLVFSVTEGLPIDAREGITRSIRNEKELASIRHNDHVYFAAVRWASRHTLKVKVWGHGDANPSGFERHYMYKVK